MNRKPEETVNGALLVISNTEVGNHVGNLIASSITGQQVYMTAIEYINTQIRHRFQYRGPLETNFRSAYAVYRYLVMLTKLFGQGDTDDVLRAMCPTIEQSIIDYHNEMLEKVIEHMANAA